MLQPKLSSQRRLWRSASYRGYRMGPLNVPSQEISSACHRRAPQMLGIIGFKVSPIVFVGDFRKMPKCTSIRSAKASTFSKKAARATFSRKRPVLVSGVAQIGHPPAGYRWQIADRPRLGVLRRSEGRECTHMAESGGQEPANIVYSVCTDTLWSRADTAQFPS